MLHDMHVAESLVPRNVGLGLVPGNLMAAQTLPVHLKDVFV